MEAATVLQTDVRPVTTILRELLNEVIDREDEFNTPDLIEYSQNRLGDDEEFKLAAARDAIAVMVPDIVKEIVRARRATIVETASGGVKKDKLEQTVRERLAHVFEGTGSGYKSFLTLRKRELLQLNDRDGKEIERRQQWVAFRADLAKKMNDTQPVADAFTSVQLGQAWKRHFPEQQTA